MSKAPKKGGKLAADEQAIYTRLFSKGPSLDLEDQNHKVISWTIDGHQASLERKYERGYFALNSAWLGPGILMSISIIMGLWLTVPAPDQVYTVPLLGLLVVMVYASATLIGKLVSAWYDDAGGGGRVSTIMQIVGARSLV